MDRSISDLPVFSVPRRVAAMDKVQSDLVRCCCFHCLLVRLSPPKVFLPSLFSLLHWLGCWSDTFHVSFTMWSGGASLHLEEEHLRGLWLRPFVSPVSPSPGLVKLLALSNNQACGSSLAWFHRTPFSFCTSRCVDTSLLGSVVSMMMLPPVSGISKPNDSSA